MVRRLSAGAVVVRREFRSYRFLLLRAYRNWDFPKGAVERGEDPVATACREVFEEAGIEDLEFRWGLAYRETGPYMKNKIARYYLAETHQPSVRISHEHHEARWVSYPEARRLLPPRVIPVLEWAEYTLRAMQGSGTGVAAA
jgi:8-oxo-dGTP pyrophosphatase MutT (NUDIX family)